MATNPIPSKSPPTKNPPPSSKIKGPAPVPVSTKVLLARSPNATPMPDPISPPSPAKAGAINAASGLPRLSLNPRRISTPGVIGRSGFKSPETPTPTRKESFGVIGSGSKLAASDAKQRPTTPVSSSLDQENQIPSFSANVKSPPRQRVMSMPPPSQLSSPPFVGKLNHASPGNTSSKVNNVNATTPAKTDGKSKNARNNHKTSSPNVKTGRESSPSISQGHSGAGLGPAVAPGGKPRPHSKTGSNVSSLGPLPSAPGVPWSSGGVLKRLSSRLAADSPSRASKPGNANRSLNGSDVDYVPPPPDSRRTSTIESFDEHWDRDHEHVDEMDMEMLTEVLEGGEIDDDVREKTSLLPYIESYTQSERFPVSGGTRPNNPRTYHENHRTQTTSRTDSELIRSSASCFTS